MKTGPPRKCNCRHCTKCKYATKARIRLRKNRLKKKFEVADQSKWSDLKLPGWDETSYIGCTWAAIDRLHTLFYG